MCKTAQLPGTTVGVVPVQYFGRELKFAGNRTFQDWTITVINDVDFSLRTAFEKWMNAINKHDDNSGLINPAQYQRDALVKQFGRSSTASANSSVTNPTQTTPGSSIPVLKAYKFYGLFPTSVSAIALSYDSTDQIEEFTVDLQVQWWDALDSQGNTQLNTDPEVLNPQ
jgi:N-acetylmuramoyl-L-alanine amidase CwlA